MYSNFAEVGNLLNARTALKARKGDDKRILGYTNWMERRRSLKKDASVALERDLEEAVAEVFTELVDNQGWSFARLALTTGVARQTLKSWHDGKISDPRYQGLAKLFYLADRSLDLLPITRPTLSREKIERLVDERVKVMLNRGLQLEIKEERIGRSFREDPQALRQSVDAIKEKVFSKPTAKTRKARVG